ncbi:MAG: hypothetical protein GWN27_11580 [candidate division Zixibacteria bacterium]|nr:hypothetical protein [candidate division Zixibacteria bacterium]
MKKIIRLISIVILAVTILAACSPNQSVGSETGELTGQDTGNNEEANVSGNAEGDSGENQAGTQELITPGPTLELEEETESEQPVETPEPAAANQDLNWLSYEYTDAVTGEPFSIQGFEDKVVLVGFFTFRCRECLTQQQEVQDLKTLLGERDDFVSVVINTDFEEDALLAVVFSDFHGFDNYYGNPPIDIIRNIGASLGPQSLDPNSIPALIYDKEGDVNILPLGLKTAEELLPLVENYLD